MVCSLASRSAFNSSAARALLVSGPMVASLIPGCCVNKSFKLARALKFSTDEALANVIQSAPSFRRRAIAPFRSSVSGTLR
jgi:hypothetical protein